MCWTIEGRALILALNQSSTIHFLSQWELSEHMTVIYPIDAPGPFLPSISSRNTWKIVIHKKMTKVQRFPSCRTHVLQAFVFLGALNCMWGWETWVYVFEHPSTEQARPTPGRCISVACKCIISVSLSCVNGDYLSFNAPITKSSFIRDNQGQKWAALHSKWTKATVTMLHNTRKKNLLSKTPWASSFHFHYYLFAGRDEVPIFKGISEFVTYARQLLLFLLLF